MARDSSPPEAARARGLGGSPGFGANKKVTVSAPSSVSGPGSTVTSSRAFGMASSRRCSTTAAAKGTAAARRTPVRARAAATRPLLHGVSALLQGPRPLLVALELRHPLTGGLAEGEHVSEGVPVLALQLPQGAPPPPDLVEAPGVVGDPLGDEPQLPLDVGDLGLPGPQPADEVLEGRPVRQRADGLTEGLEHRPLQRPVRHRECLPVRRGVRQECLLRLEGDLLTGVVEPGRVDLFHLEPQEVELPRPGAGVAAEGGQLTGQVAFLRPRRWSVSRASAAGDPANRSSAARCVPAAKRRCWACWACSSTRLAPAAASSPTVASRPSR